MAAELYTILEVGPNASPDEIREAYRRLAKKYHPDLNPGDKTAEENFKKVQTAYDILSDGEKRGQYDRGEIDAQGNETQRSFYREYASTDGASPYHSAAGFEDLSDIFSDLFGRGAGGPGGSERVDIRMRGGDVRYTMEVPFLEAVQGTKKRVSMPDGASLDISIPPGVREGQILRLRGKGMPGYGGAEPGDAFVEVHVATDAMFQRRGNDILVDLPVTVYEAVLGAKVRVPTVSGAVTMTIPAGSNTGDTLRLKGKGVPAASGRKAGDQLVSLRVVLPKAADDELHTFMERWAKDHAYDPRSGMGI